MTMNAQTIRDAIRQEFTTLAFARDMFPMLTQWGVKDESVAVHSLGCNYLSALGRQLGHWAASEYPVRVGRKYVRPDVVWWSRPAGEAVLIGEFERFDAGQQSKLLEKARNLMEAYDALHRKPRVILLVAWTLAGTDLAGSQTARLVAFDGVRASDGHYIAALGPETVFVLAYAVFGQSAGQCRLLEMHL
jgi:hypothetical protein